jgi:hypothetical protein
LEGDFFHENRGLLSKRERLEHRPKTADLEPIVKMTITIDQHVIFAARAGNLPLLKDRVEAGGNINHIDPQHGSALAEAIRGRHIEVLEWLIANGANVTIQYRDAFGPLELALVHPDSEVVYQLVCAGAKLTRTARPNYRKRLEGYLKATSKRKT